MADKIRQWPDNITSGEIRFDPSGHFEGGYVLRDVQHGIPVFGSVNVEVFNYPGQTEAIAKALCDRWNAHHKLAAALANLLAVTDPYRKGYDTSEGADQELAARKQAVAALNEIGVELHTQDAEGWMDWAGDAADNAPVLALIEIERRDGLKGRGWSESMFWQHDGRGDDILRYRVLS